MDLGIGFCGIYDRLYVDIDFREACVTSLKMAESRNMNKLPAHQNSQAEINHLNS